MHPALVLLGARIQVIRLDIDAKLLQILHLVSDFLEPAAINQLVDI